MRIRWLVSESDVEDRGIRTAISNLLRRSLARAVSVALFVRENGSVFCCENLPGGNRKVRWGSLIVDYEEIADINRVLLEVYWSCSPIGVVVSIYVVYEEYYEMRGEYVRCDLIEIEDWRSGSPDMVLDIERYIAEL